MGLCQCRKTTLERVETVDIAKHVVIAVSYLMMSVPSEGQNLSANQISMTYLHSRLRYYYFRFGKQTSAILEYRFRFPPRPLRHNRRVILHQAAEFRPNRTTHGAAAQYYFRFRICWCHCLQVKIYQQTKFRGHISIHSWDITTSGLEKQTSTILEFYFRFLSRSFRRNRRVFLHQAAEFCLNQTIQRSNKTSYRFSRWRPSAMLYLLWGNGRPPTKCLSWSELGPQIAWLPE